MIRAIRVINRLCVVVFVQIICFLDNQTRGISMKVGIMIFSIVIS